MRKAPLTRTHSPCPLAFSWIVVSLPVPPRGRVPRKYIGRASLRKGRGPSAAANAGETCATNRQTQKGDKKTHGNGNWRAPPPGYTSRNRCDNTTTTPRSPHRTMGPRPPRGDPAVHITREERNERGGDMLSGHLCGARWQAAGRALPPSRGDGLLHFPNNSRHTCVKNACAPRLAYSARGLPLLVAVARLTPSTQGREKLHQGAHERREQHRN